MAKFIHLSNKDREKLFKEIKDKLNGPWENFYTTIGIGKVMFYHYSSGKYDIPKEVYNKMLEAKMV